MFETLAVFILIGLYILYTYSKQKEVEKIRLKQELKFEFEALAKPDWEEKDEYGAITIKYLNFEDMTLKSITIVDDSVWEYSYLLQRNEKGWSLALISDKTNFGGEETIYVKNGVIQSTRQNEPEEEVRKLLKMNLLNNTVLAHKIEQHFIKYDEFKMKHGRFPI